MSNAISQAQAQAENTISTTNISIGKKLVDGYKSCFSKAHNAFGKSFEAITELEEIKIGSVGESDALADATLFKFLADLFNSIIKRLFSKSVDLI